MGVLFVISLKLVNESAYLENMVQITFVAEIWKSEFSEANLKKLFVSYHPHRKKRSHPGGR